MSSSSSSDTLPLHDLRVIDFTRLLPGPYATLVLADMGADVIKVEDPKGGDYLRMFPPTMEGSNYGARFASLNTGKRSVALDLKHPDGVAAAKRLMAEADVVFESFRPGVMDRLGLGYDAASEANPKLIYCAISGYGQDGPLRNRAGHDINYQALGGVLGLAGPRNGPPELPAAQLADIGGGALWPLIGVLTALHARHGSGRGRFVDASMTDGSLGFLQMALADQLITGAHPPRGEAMLTGGQSCYGVYETADGGAMAVGSLEPKFWAAFCKAVGRPDLMARHLGPIEKTSETRRELEVLFRTKTRLEWEQVFADADACVEPVLRPDELFDHPLHIARNNVITDDRGMKRIRTPMRPVGAPSPRRAPELGEHTRQVLSEAGYGGGEVDALLDARAAKAAPSDPS